MEKLQGILRDGVQFEIKPDGTARVVKYTGAAAEISVPAEVDGVPVTEIGDGAFGHCAGLRAISIPDSVERIGDWAFEDCTELESVVVPADVEISDRTFECCPGKIIAK